MKKLPEMNVDDPKTAKSMKEIDRYFRKEAKISRIYSGKQATSETLIK